MVYSYKHHIIPLHEWKRRINPKATRWNKDYNVSDNVVWLTLKQHIHVHYHYWELTGNQFDWACYLALSGQIGKEESRRLACALANSTRKHSEKSKREQSIFMTGNKYALGSKRDEKWKKEQAARKKGLLIGYKHPKEFGEAISARMMGNQFAKGHKKKPL